MKAPLTLDQLIEKLKQLRRVYPEYGDRPVHLLDMKEPEDPETIVSGLATHVEMDCFDEAQGPVTSLMSWPDEDCPR